MIRSLVIVRVKSDGEHCQDDYYFKNIAIRGLDRCLSRYRHLPHKPDEARPVPEPMMSLNKNAITRPMAPYNKCSSAMYKLRTCLLQGMVMWKIFVADVMKSPARGIWRSPEPREKVVDSAGAALDQVMRAAGGSAERERQSMWARETKRSGKRAHSRNSRGTRGLESGAREAQEAEKFRVRNGMRRTAKSQHGSVTGTCDTEGGWRSARALVCSYRHHK